MNEVSKDEWAEALLYQKVVGVSFFPAVTYLHLDNGVKVGYWPGDWDHPDTYTLQRND